MVVASFYQFLPLTNLLSLSRRLRHLFDNFEVRGTILLATEGINAALVHHDEATLAGAISGLQQMESNWSFRPVYSRASGDTTVFDRLDIRIRDEIVSFGSPYDHSKQVGTRVSPAEWNDLLAKDSTLVLDVRNHYESRLGAFDRAVSMDTQTFSEFVPQIAARLLGHQCKTIAMYCTGGIRCEKASQHLKTSRKEEIVQLDRGILGYFEAQVDPTRWNGECFVFDKRVSVTPDLQAGSATLCLACRSPLSTEDQNSSQFVYGLSCPHCINQLTTRRAAALHERMKQLRLKHLTAERKDCRFNAL